MKTFKKLKQFLTSLKTSDIDKVQDLEIQVNDLKLENQILNQQLSIKCQEIINQSNIIRHWKYISIFLLIYSLVSSLVIFGLANNI